MGEPEIPQAAFARLGLKAFEDFGLALRIGPPVAILADLGQELLGALVPGGRDLEFLVLAAALGVALTVTRPLTRPLFWHRF